MRQFQKETTRKSPFVMKPETDVIRSNEHLLRDKSGRRLSSSAPWFGQVIFPRTIQSRLTFRASRKRYLLHGTYNPVLFVKSVAAVCVRISWRLPALIRADEGGPGSESIQSGLPSSRSLVSIPAHAHSRSDAHTCEHGEPEVRPRGQFHVASMPTKPGLP